MKITYEGQVYDFDLLRTPVAELREMKRKFPGMTVRQFLRGVTEVDVDAMLCLKWAVLRSDGRHDDLLLNPDDPFTDYWEFVEAWNASGAGEDEASEEDPTLAGSLPATPIPPSSESSAPTSASSPSPTPLPSPASAESPSGISGVSPSPASSPTSPALMP